MTLDLLDVTYEVPGRRILQGVSLAIRPGRFSVLLGPNGTGKTTLMRCMAGDLTPTSGEVRIDGQPMQHLTPLERACRRAVMTQQVVVSFDFLVEEVVLLGRTPHSTNESSTISATIARKALEVMGLSHLARRSIRTLSGGEAQRVHLARALAQVWQGDPAPGGGNASPYLLLDEPVSALDMQWQHEVMAELAALASQGYAVFAILHDLNLAAQYAHEVAFLKDGQIVAAGHVHQTLTSENVHHVYGVHTTVWQHPVADCPLIVQHSSPRLQSTRRRAASQPLSHPVAHPQPAPEPVHESFIP